jgi:nitroreductase
MTLRLNTEDPMLELIKKRRSIRRYTREPISDADVAVLLEAAMAAPSADNLQPWEFVVVRDAGLRRQLAETHPWSRMCADAPVVFVVCGHERRSGHWVEDASAATENLLLAAAGLDLGAVWVGVYPQTGNEEHVRRVLSIPRELRVLCLVPVGHPGESKPPHTKYDERKVHYDGY